MLCNFLLGYCVVLVKKKIEIFIKFPFSYNYEIMSLTLLNIVNIIKTPGSFTGLMIKFFSPWFCQL